MNQTQAQVGQDFPREITLRDGTAMTLRLMGADDRDAVVTFARSLPPDDLLFLRTDITDPGVVDEWVENIRRGRTITVLAEPRRGAGIAGYGSLHYNDATWTRHVGELRLQVGPLGRGKGLGRHLAAAMFDLGRDLGLKKIQARMTTDQQAARSTLERLGFYMEALLHNYVLDRNDRPRDMLIMSYDVEGLTDRGD